MRVHGVYKNLGAAGVYTEYGQQYLKSACEALDQVTCQILADVEKLEASKFLKCLVLPVWIERTTSPLPRVHLLLANKLTSLIFPLSIQPCVSKACRDLPNWRRAHLRAVACALARRPCSP